MIDHEEFPLLGTPNRPGLVDLVRSRDLCVPEFQRTFLWSRKPDKTTSLLASIAQEWPAGALLLMEGDRGFQPRAVDGWKQDAGVSIAKSVKYALLDGQQRMTALYQAFFNRSADYVFAVAILDVLRTAEIDPEEGGTFQYFTRRTWDRSTGSVEKQRDKGLISVADLVNPKAFEYWKDGYDADTKADLSELRQEGALAGLLRYQFPVSIVLKSAPDEALANIFVTINQQGIKLTTFDLVVAKTVKRARGGSKGFNLRDVWDRAAGREETEDEPAIPPRFERLRTFGIEPEVPLRLVRLVVDPTAKLSDTSILALTPADVQQRVERALDVLDKVLAFLEARIGLIPQTLPDPNYILPIALATHTKPAILKNARDAERVLQWYWASTFQLTFGRGRTGDVIPKETAALLDWLIHFGPDAPEAISGFWRAFDQDLRFRFFQGTAQNQHFMRAMFALEVADGAIDWKGEPDGQGNFTRFELKDAASTWPIASLDIHHMWARGVKKPAKAKQRYQGIEIPHGEQAYESVVNRCLLLKSTNIAIGNTPFPAVKDLENVRPTWLKSYLIDPRGADWETFVVGRFTRMKKALEARVPKL